jgi:hypothetical protein
VPGKLSGFVDSFVAALADFDPQRYSPDHCVTIVESLARVEKACAAARARAASRVAAAGAHRTLGFANPAEWLAQQTGSSSAEADRDLQTVAALDDLPAAKSALERGDISLAQADEVRRTEAACPGSEAEMVETAKTHGLRKTKEEGRAKRLAAVDPKELHDRQRAARFHKHWKDELGMIRYCGAMMPGQGVPFIHRLDAETDRQFRNAHKEGRVEQRECYAADAFAKVVSGQGKGSSTRADVVFVCDVSSGEAHIVGSGPVPMSTVRAAAEGAFIKAVLHDGVKVDTVVHYGRKAPPAHVRTVLELGDPPEFNGVTCVDCGRQFRLEWDHVDPVANGGPTCRSNFEPRCHPCHTVKTERDRLAGLLRRKTGRDPP